MRLELHLFILIALAVRESAEGWQEQSEGLQRDAHGLCVPVVVFLRGSCVRVTSYSEWSLKDSQWRATLAGGRPHRVGSRQIRHAEGAWG